MLRKHPLLPLKAFYLLNFGALGALFPYLPLLLERRGLDDTQISLVMVTVPVCSLLVPPIWGGLADMLRVRLRLLQLASVGCGAASLLLLPEGGLALSLLAVGALSFFRAPITSLADATTYDAMGGADPDFSRVRVWGSVGFAGLALVVGMGQGSAVAAIPIGVATTGYLLSAAVTLPLKAPPLARERGLLREARGILLRPPMLIFLLGQALYYAAHSTYDVYFGLHVVRIGHDDAFVGMAWAIGVGVEVLLMLLAPRFIRRVPPGWLLIPCALLAALRWLLLSTVTSTVPLLAVQALHGVTFGVWYLSMVRFVQNLAPNRLRTTLQSVASMCLGVGMIIGYLVGGQIMDASGGATLYRMSSVSALAGGLCYLIALLLARRR